MQWEYITVEFKDVSAPQNELKAYKIRGKLVDDWKNGQPFDEVIQQMGDQGWEMMAFPAPFVIFKRPK